MTPTGDTKPKLLFYEPGASWYWVLTGPLAAVSVLLLEISSGAGVGLITPAIFLVMVSAFVALQVKAARIHTSVELTHDALRQGTETIRLAEIVKIYPEADGRETSGEEPAKWQSARTLGELVGVPRGRVGIGLKLTGGRTAQAWARRHQQLRAALIRWFRSGSGPWILMSPTSTVTTPGQRGDRPLPGRGRTVPGLCRACRICGELVADPLHRGRRARHRRPAGHPVGGLSPATVGADPAAGDDRRRVVGGGDGQVAARASWLERTSGRLEPASARRLVSLSRLRGSLPLLLDRALVCVGSGW